MASYIGRSPSTTKELDDNEVTTAKINDSAVTTAKIADGTIAIADLSATGTKDNTTFLRGDNTFQVVNTDLVSDTTPQLGGNLDGNGSTIDLSGNTTHFNLPKGTTAQRTAAASGNEGAIRYDTDDNVVYFSDGTNWYKIAAAVPTLTGVTGSIYVSSASNLTLAGTNFLSSNLVVNFTQTSDSIDSDVTVTPTSDTAATVAVPAAVYNNVTAGNAVTIKVTNSDGIQSGGQNTTAVALPTGGTISNSGGYRIHTFNSSANFVNTLTLSNIEYLIIAGGAGGGFDDGSGWAGGGGAGGYRNSTGTETSGRSSSTESKISSLGAGTYAVTVGAGGAGVSSGSSQGTLGGTGGNSSFNSITSNGGGYGQNSTVSSAGNGGSGGGSANGSTASPNAGSGTAGQGYDGTNSTNTTYATGGGGAGGTGSGAAVDGGLGLSSSITGSAVTRAGGGGGSVDGTNPGTHNGTAGGGGSASYNQPSIVAGGNGTANTGGGGGGSISGATSGNGGSGVVIIRYQL